MTTHEPAPEQCSRPDVAAAIEIALGRAAPRSDRHVERFRGPPARRARLEGRLRTARAAGDQATEKELCALLARELSRADLDLGRALALAERALEIDDDEGLRAEAAGWLACLGRSEEAARLLRQDRHPKGRSADWLVQVGTLHARAGNSAAAVKCFRVAGLLDPGQARSFELLAQVASWAPEALPAHWAADAWLQAARLHDDLDAEAMLDLARACLAAPDHRPAAEAYADALGRQGRHGAHDEVLRRLDGRDAAGEASCRRRFARASERGAAALALAAALDHALAADGGPAEERTALLRELCGGPGPDGSPSQGDTLAARALGAALAALGAEPSPGRRAQELMEASRGLDPERRAVLLAAAADCFAADGQRERAREVAELGCRVAPAAPRPFAALAALGLDDLGPAQTEDAVAVLPASPPLLHAMARKLEAAGSPSLALVWAEQALELVPGDADAWRRVLGLAVATGEPGRVAGALARAALLARPLTGLGKTLGAALDALHRLDPRQALDSGAQLLEAVGPGDPALDDALRALGAAHAEHPLARALLARLEARPGTGPEERAALLVRAAHDRQRAGDGDGAADLLRRSAALGVAARRETQQELCDSLARSLDAAPDEQRSDILLALVQTRAELAGARGQEEAIASWRQLGALRWDLADDRLGAEDAFFASCRLDPIRAPEMYAADLFDRAATPEALGLVLARARALPAEEGRLAGRILAAASRLAWAQSQPEGAAEAALEALRRDPSHTEPLAVLEQAATGPQGLAALGQAYDLLSTSAVGPHGRRAAHYRAARQFEQRGAYDLAWRHAVGALEAVPGEGAVFELVLRLAGACGEHEATARAISRIAVGLDAPKRALWLRRAAALLPATTEGRDLRYVLLLQAFRAQPAAAELDELESTVRELAARHEDDEATRLRLARAVGAVEGRLSGTPGAALAVRLATLAAEILEDGALGTRLLRRAIEHPESDFSPLLPQVRRLAAAPEAAELCAQLEALARPGAGDVSQSLVLLAAELSRHVEEPAPQTKRGLPGAAAPAAARGAPGAAAAAPAAPKEPEQELPRLTPPFGTRPPPELVAEQRRRDHEAIAELLKARAEATDNLARRRVVRLRRAAVLDQDLGRGEDACRELELLLAEVGEDGTVLRCLANLLERRGEATRAAHFWQRAAATAGGDEKLRDVVRACEAALAAGDTAAVRRVLGHAPDLPASPTLVEIRETGQLPGADPRALAQVLYELRRLNPLMSDRAPASDAAARAAQAPPSDKRGQAPGAGGEPSGDQALKSAEDAFARGDLEAALRDLEQAAGEAGSRAAAEQRLNQWFGVGPDSAPSLRPKLSWTSSWPPLVADESTEDEPTHPGTHSGPEPEKPAPAPLPSPVAAAAGRDSADADLLGAELEGGSFEAGDRLAELYAASGQARSADIVAIRHRQALIRLGDRGSLTRLREAAIADRNDAATRAAEHVLAAFDPKLSAPAAPPLGEQVAQPKAMADLLFEHLRGTVNEALAIAYASGCFRRTLANYELSGSERVFAMAGTPVSAVFGELMRLLGMVRIRLFWRPAPGPLTGRVALLDPPAAIISGLGDRESPALRYAVGHAMAAAMPECAIAQQSEAALLGDLLGALAVGFGPPERAPGQPTAEQSRLAQELWHRLPAAAERRLKAICASADMSAQAAVRGARRASRRAGLFACGDLCQAIRAALAELRAAGETDLEEPTPGPDALRQLCREPSIADLVRLAIDPLYADGRWSSRTVPPP
ncbi:MAG: hypothetical protein HY744_10005 [Deltaproteobacteria bacterium]|nr:hypothetical protein [Deltaproteobacteria bacterium]